MKPIIHLLFCAVALGLAAAAPAPSTAPATAPSTAPAGPKNAQGLSAAIIAGKDTYTLDPNQSGKDFRDRLQQPKNAQAPGIKPAGNLPRPPAVDLTFRITNNSDRDVTITTGGDDSQMQLSLAGPGAITVDNNIAMTMEFRIGTPVTIAAGKTYDVKISSLAFGMRGITQCAYWTEPGDYVLIATLTYGMTGEKQGKVESTPIKLKVEAPK